MELKPYQKKVLADLESYLEYVQAYKRIDQAFNEFWKDRAGAYNPISGEGMEPYKNNVPCVPNVCIKVPTAGGKTFIAANALKVIFNAFNYDKTKAVVWLVPSVTILDQTIKNLSDINHPYRQRINTHFGGKVEVYTKDALLQGAGFSPASVNEQLSILILSFDSLRSRKKEDRKIYQENGQLASFAEPGDTYHLLENTDDTALINVIRKLNPVIIVDESHNAESELSVEMLKNLNPCFVLDLTATPRNNSNIISYVNAFELKRENMVKLPVIVYNHHDKTEVVNSALQLRKRLELLAQKEEKTGGRYIRPIVLFQAQPRTGEDNTTFEKLKQKLVELQIPGEQIKIKTADEFAEKTFNKFIDADKIKIREVYKIPETQFPGDTEDYGIAKSLYGKEFRMNDFERRAINDIANLDNIILWTKNPDKKGLRINGFINHYPDFIVITKSGKVLIFETKGDDRDNTDSMQKIKLGKTWANKAGDKYKYFMIFDKNSMDGAYTLADAIKIIAEL